MKKIFKYTIHVPVMLIMLLTITACEDGFLEVTPKGRLIAQNTNDYNLMLNSISLINFHAQSLSLVLGDELIARDPFFGVRPDFDQRLFRYEDDIYNPEQEPTELTSLTRALYHFNKIINEVMDSEGGTEEEKKQIRAEALTGRVWIYLQYTTLFTKPYNQATAATDLGFPIIAEADINRSPYARGTLQETYQFMIDDITTAIPDLPAIITSRHRASRAVAQSFLGKVYMAMGRFSDALPYLEEAVSTIESNTGVITNLYDFNIEILPGGALYSAAMASRGLAHPNNPNNRQNIYGRQNMSFYGSSFNNYLVLSPQAATLYQAEDLRRFYYNNTNLAYPSGSLRRLGPTFHITGLLIPEVYLMRAECRARTNKLYGSGSAAEDLLYLRERRMPAVNAAVPAGLTQTQMIQFVIDERLREFAFTGLRWFDMRRLSVDPLFSGTNYTHTLYYEDGTTESFPLRPERFTLRIPRRILDDNPGMEDNP